MVGMITAARATAKAPDLKYWANAIIETGSHESMLSGLKGSSEDGLPPGTFFWHLKIDGVPV